MQSVCFTVYVSPSGCSRPLCASQIYLLSSVRSGTLLVCNQQDIVIGLLAQEDELAAGEECKRDSE